MQTLPIDDFLPQILQGLSSTQRGILTASPGAGKSTRLPPELLKVVQGKIAVLQPRRLAAVASAHRIAQERGWQLGKEVGYQVRFDSKKQKDTRLIYYTDALFLRHWMQDPEFKEFELVIIDEFHERNLQQDLLLGLIKELQEMGSSLKVLVMSATLDVESLGKFLPDHLHFDIPGKVFPLQVEHVTNPPPPPTDRDFYSFLAQQVEQKVRKKSGDILVFLPGVGEIHKAQEELQKRNLGRSIFPLHGSLSLEEQQSVLGPKSEARILLATNIAEASLTLDGVDTVIDSGLAKVSEVHLQSGFSKLQLRRIAKFNARQRAGRAARQKEGVCLRLWTIHEESSLSESLAPECQRTHLHQSLLLLAHGGFTDFAQFSWLTPPPPRLLKSALEYLQHIEALDSEQRITELGRDLLRYPLEPRIAMFLRLSQQAKLNSRKCAEAAALLQEMESPKSNSPDGQESDLFSALQEFQKFPQRLRKSADQLEALLPEKFTLALDTEELLVCLLKSHPDRLCKRRGKSERGLMVGGRGVKLSPHSQVKESPFFLALQGIDLPGQQETLISVASGLTKAFLMEHLATDIEDKEILELDSEKQEFLIKRSKRFWDLSLDEPQIQRPDPQQLQTQMVQALQERWDWLLEQNESLGDWWSRWQFYNGQRELTRSISEEQIQQALEWASFGKTSLQQVLQEPLISHLESQLDPQWKEEFHKEAPSHFLAPSEHRHRIHYSTLEPPYVEVRLQEVFGLQSSPVLGKNQRPLVFKLLAPNFRPVQVTEDLASFWKNTYFEVRKELRTRYPKHSWPENPLEALPVAKGTRRKS